MTPTLPNASPGIRTLDELLYAQTPWLDQLERKDTMSKTDLLDQAKDLGIKGRTRMNEAELTAAIVDAQKQLEDTAEQAAEQAAYLPFDEKSGIFERLALVQWQVPQVMKTGQVAFGGTSYSHIQEHGILAVLKPLMQRYKISLLADVVEWARDGNHSTLNVAYTVFCADQPRNDSDPNLSVTVHFITEGVDSGDKGMNKALTNGMKYALQKLFLIPTDAIDDVEGSDAAHNTASNSTTGGNAKASNTVLARLRARAASAVENELIPNNTVKAHLSAEYGTSKVTDLTGDQAVKFGTWLDEQGVPKAG